MFNQTRQTGEENMIIISQEGLIFFTFMGLALGYLLRYCQDKEKKK